MARTFAASLSAATLAATVAVAARDTHGLVHCIDLFPRREDWYRNADGTWSFQVRIGGETFGAYQQQTVWAEPFAQRVATLYDAVPDVHAEFQARMTAAGLQSIVRALHEGLIEGARPAVAVVELAGARIAEALDRRRKAIDDSIDSAQRTKREADDLLEEYDSLGTVEAIAAAPDAF